MDLGNGPAGILYFRSWKERSICNHIDIACIIIQYDQILGGTNCPYLNIGGDVSPCPPIELRL